MSRLVKLKGWLSWNVNCVQTVVDCGPCLLTVMERSLPAE